MNLVAADVRLHLNRFKLEPRYLGGYGSFRVFGVFHGYSFSSPPSSPQRKRRRLSLISALL
jgi:hypothetical protein